MSRSPSAPFALSHDDVRQIRARLAAPCSGCGRPHTAASLAPVYGVSKVTIWKAANRVTYPDIGDAG